jgi:uncharacterized protein
MQQSGEEVSLGWQGGEPTLMGLPFFQRAVELEKRYGEAKTVGNGLQTNGILLSSEWARFFKQYNFLIGLSLDGPAHIHDHYRRMQGGQGSWSRVADNARLLLDAGVSVNALTVVNDYSARFAAEIYAFHKELGLNYMQFIPCVETDPENPERAAPFSVSAEGYGTFLCKLFDLWLADFVNGAPTTSIRFFESLLFSYAGLAPPECTLQDECGRYVVVEHNGDVYACDFFVEPGWKLGNVMESRLADMLNSPKQVDFGKWKSNLPAGCGECTWLTLCRGGCTKDRIRDPRDRNLNHFCAAFKMFFAHADSDMRRLVAEWRRKQEGLQRATIAHDAGIGRNAPCPCGSGLKYKKCCGRI